MKGSFHIHSKFEEGKFSLDTLKDLHIKKGYKFVFLTEHNRLNSLKSYNNQLKMISYLNDNDFSFIPGIEIESVEGPHILLINQRRYIQSNMRIKDIFLLKEKEALIFLAHPKFDQFNFLRKYPFDGVEIWNSRNDGFGPNLLLLIRLKLWGYDRLILIGGPDAHTSNHFFKVDLIFDNKVKIDNIISKIKSGDFYLSRNGQIFRNNSDIFSPFFIINYVYIRLYNLFIHTFGILFRFFRISSPSKLEKLVDYFK